MREGVREFRRGSSYFGKNSLKLAASTGEARHDSADWNAGDIGNLLVRYAFEFAKRDRFPKFRKQLFNRRAHGLSILHAIELDACVHRRGFCAVQFFIEDNIHFLWSILSKSGERNVP